MPAPPAWRRTTGGALLTLGRAQPPIASTLISSTMITAIRKVHAKNGVWATNGGYEYNLVLIAAATALVDNGAGPLSVDAALFPRLKGSTLAALSLAAAAAGSYLATSPPMAQAEDSGPDRRGGDAGERALRARSGPSRGDRATSLVMGVHDGVTPAAGDEPAVDRGTRTTPAMSRPTARLHQKSGSPRPAEMAPGHDDDEEVVDDLHDRDLTPCRRRRPAAPPAAPTSRSAGAEGS